jgi:uncharacterized protein (TIGR02996 family)
MNQLDGLLATILANPADDMPRLVYADALEESGQVERAEYIRLAIDLHNNPATTGSDRDLKFNRLKAKKLFPHIPREINGVVRRGFIESVRCPLGAWLEHGPRIVAEHPVERVEITDREPREDGWFWYWMYEGEPDLAPHWIPNRLARPTMYNTGDCCGSHASREKAMDALSAACLAWAKSMKAYDTLGSTLVAPPMQGDIIPLMRVVQVP